jgi:hypothetical protein
MPKKSPMTSRGTVPETATTAQQTPPSAPNFVVIDRGAPIETGEPIIGIGAGAQGGDGEKGGQQQAQDQGQGQSQGASQGASQGDETAQKNAKGATTKSAEPGKLAASYFARKFLGKSAAESEEQPKEEPGESDEDKTAQTAESDEPDKTQQRARRRRGLQKEDIKEVAKAVASTVAEAVSKNMPQPPPVLPPSPPPPPQPEPENVIKVGEDVYELSNEDLERLDVLRYLERTKPDKYADITKRYMDSIRKALEYRARWEKENPGEEFNPADHEEALAAFEVDYDEDDYVSALASMRAEKIAEQRIRAIEQEQRMRQAFADAARAQGEAVAALFKELGGEFAEAAKNGQVDPDTARKLAEEDPAGDVAMRAASRLAAAVNELELLSRGAKPFDPANEIHKGLAQLIDEQEKYIESLPPEKQIVDGKKFVRASLYAVLPEEQRANCWRLTTNDVRNILINQFAHMTKSEIQKLEEKLTKIAQKKGWLKSNAEEQRQYTKAEPLPPHPALRQEKPVTAPTVSPIPAPVGASGPTTPPSAKDSFAARFIG